MTTRMWIGTAPPVSQVGNLTPGGLPLPGDVNTVTINGKVVSYTVAAATVADVCTGLQAALTASAIPEFQEVAWTNPASTAVVGTSLAAGKPFTATVGLTKANVAPPVLNTPTLTAGGALSNGTPYYYKASATNSNGETLPSAEVTATPSGGNLSLVVTWAVVPGATGYKLYRTTSAGTYGASTLLTTIGAGSTVTFTDIGNSTGAGTPAGANTALSTATFVLSTPTASSGPNDWSVAGNWSPSGVPVTGDDVYLQNSTVNIAYGLAQAAVTLASLNSDGTFTGKIGNPEWTGNYFDYRPTYLAIGATTINIGKGPGQGSSQIKLDTGSVQTTLNLFGASTPATTGRQAVLWKGTHPSNVINVNKGSFGAATLAGEVATILTLNEGFTSNVQGDSTVFLGAGCTLTTIKKTGGDLTVQSGVTTLQQNDGTCTVLAGAITTLNLDGGILYDQGTGTLTTVSVLAAGTLDFSRDLRGRSVTNCTLHKGARLLDPGATVTFSNPISVPDGTLQDVTLNVGFNRSYLPS